MAKKTAPTRPHPSAPDKPPANKLLAPGGGLVDRVRHALSGRQGCSTEGVVVMDSHAKALGHPIHPMLIVYPLGLLSTAVIFDICYLVTDRDGFPVAAAYTIAAGVIGGLVAALFGLIDWLAIPAGTRAKRIG